MRIRSIEPFAFQLTPPQCGATSLRGVSGAKADEEQAPMLCHVQAL